MKSLKFRELRRKLQRHDKQFKFFENKGKGSHRMIYHPDINGRAVSMPLPCHNEGAEVKKSYYKQIQRRFNLPANFFK